jgi:hypothetical protein
LVRARESKRQTNRFIGWELMIGDAGCAIGLIFNASRVMSGSVKRWSALLSSADRGVLGVRLAHQVVAYRSR